MSSRTGSCRLVCRGGGHGGFDVGGIQIVETRCQRRSRGHNLVSVARAALRAPWSALVSHCCGCRDRRHNGLAVCCCSTGRRNGGSAARDAKGCAAHSSVAGQKGRRPGLCREGKSRRGFRKATGGGAWHKDPIAGGIRLDGTSARRRGKTSRRACKRYATSAGGKTSHRACQRCAKQEQREARGHEAISSAGANKSSNSNTWRCPGPSSVLQARALTRAGMTTLVSLPNAGD
jgi:hypothetical protein